MGSGAAFFRVSAAALVEHAAELERSFGDDETGERFEQLGLVANLQRGAWDAIGPELRDVLAVVTFFYGAYGDSRLAFLRGDATRAEWEAHLARLPAQVRKLAHGVDVLMLTREERLAAASAFERGEADGWRRLDGLELPVAREQWPQLFVEPGDEALDVVLIAGVGERTWLTADDFPETRPGTQLPPAVKTIFTPGYRPAGRVAESGALETWVARAGGAATWIIALPYVALVAVVPLVGYPMLLPSMLGNDDWRTALMLLGMMVGIGLMPLALVQRRLGPKAWGAVIAVHALGLMIGTGRWLWSR